MSADNGIYIAQFKDDHGDSFRVAHGQAIESCDYDSMFAKKLTDAYRVLYFGKAPEFSTKQAAMKYALELEEQIMDSSCPILEYGISTLRFNVPFPEMTYEEADAYVNSYDFRMISPERTK